MASEDGVVVSTAESEAVEDMREGGVVVPMCIFIGAAATITARPVRAKVYRIVKI